MTLEQLRTDLKTELAICYHPSDGSIYDQVDRAIQEAWDNWDFDYCEYSDEDYKPKFRDEWIDNETFEFQLERINDEEKRKLFLD